MKFKLGFMLTMLGAMAADSDNMLIPIGIVFAGSLLMLWAQRG